jgi:hypothetical protein
MNSWRAWSVLAVMIATTAPPAWAQPAPAALPVWPGHVEGGAVAVDAQDVDGDLLRSVLAPASTSYVTTPTGAVVTGRVRVNTRAAALTALVAHAPALAVTPRPMRGVGRNVDLDFTAAPSHDLYRVLADVLRVNVVVTAPSTALDVRIQRRPAGGVLAEVARASGAAIDRPARNLFVVRAASASPMTALPTGGAKLRLDARKILAGHLVELIRVLDGPPAPAELLRDAAIMCGAGQPLELRLRQLPTTTALALVARVGGINLRAPRCALPPLPGDPTADLMLTATAARGRTRVAAVEVAGRAYHLAHGGAWTVGDAWIEHRGAQETRQWRLYPSAMVGPPPVRSARSPRLAATIIDGRTRLAIVEDAAGFRVWRADRPVVTDDGAVFTIAIVPGEVQVRDGPTLRLAPRTP